jgi:hypothetical protein
MELYTYLKKKLTIFNASKELAIQASSHLVGRYKKDLFSQKYKSRRIAEGYWYEALIYEKIKTLSKNCDLIQGIIRKGADVSLKTIKQSRCKNGIQYDFNSSIVLKGNEQELAEIDMLIVDSKSQLYVIEITTSDLNLKEFDKEIIYKRELLLKVTNYNKINFIIISSLNLLSRKPIIALSKMSDIYFINTGPYEKNKSHLAYPEVNNYLRKELVNEKIIDVNSLNINKKFDYNVYHDKVKSIIFSAMKSNKDIDIIKKELGEYTIVPKVIIGNLLPEAVNYLCRENVIVVNEDIFTAKEILKYFSNVILTVKLPDLRPAIYLKVKPRYIGKKKIETYLKLGLKSNHMFSFERNIPIFAGFFKWLDTIKPTLGAKTTKSFCDYFSKKEVYRSKKRHSTPNFVK